MMITKALKLFIDKEQSGGFILIGCTIISILLANSVGGPYIRFWESKLGFHNDILQLQLSLEHWINDGLMTIFFLLVGLEIKRELYIGELSSAKKAMLPVFAAVGGMIVPAILHFFLNRNTSTQAGFGIPMATDIAFALGVLSLLGNRIPVSLKVFLTAFAIIDDLGAIIIIAIAYTKSLSLAYLLFALAIFGLLLLMNRLKIHHLIFYIIPGIIMWYCMLQSGVHATVSGILFAFSLPFGKNKVSSASSRLEHFLHKPVNFFILPLFALANTCIIFQENWRGQLVSSNSLGILTGLILGKPIGIMLFSGIAVRSGVGQLSQGLNWNYLFGASLLGGIGFTMSIFITLLAFTDETTIISSKIAVLLSSCIAGLGGYFFLRKIKVKILVPS